MSGPSSVLATPLTECARPETIPHLAQQQNNSQNPASGSLGPGTPGLYPTASQGQSGSPVKEPSILQRGMSMDEQGNVEDIKAPEKAAPTEEVGIPIRKS